MPGIYFKIHTSTRDTLNTFVVAFFKKPQPEDTESPFYLYFHKDHTFSRMASNIQGQPTGWFESCEEALSHIKEAFPEHLYEILE